MSQWNPDQYLKFEKERSRPARDLAASIMDRTPKTIADLGCGPGNSTAVLKAFFPEADIVGFDSSEAMIKKAQADHPDLAFVCRDIRKLDGRYDLLFCNAVLQWLPDHERLIPDLVSHLNPGGCLAVQVPQNEAESLYKIADGLLEQYGLKTGQDPVNRTLSFKEYSALFAENGYEFSIWTTSYGHVLENHQALIEWIKGTRLRPYLDRMMESEQSTFEKDLLHELEKAYQPLPDGRILFQFRRLFFTVSGQ